MALLCALVLTPMAAQATPAAAAAAMPPNPLANPKHNTAPSQRFVDACHEMGTSKAANDKCDAAALHDFDAVRKKEGLGRITLPGDFASLSVPSQLLAISNIERVDRGRRPVKGRTKSLDKLAEAGANRDQDPNFPQPCGCTFGGANWAGAGNSALLDDFYWMYDDGPGSFNNDCPQRGASGCWGHRHNILHAYAARLIMGAAVAYKTRFGTSMTEEFIGGDRSDKVIVSPSWHRIAATFPPRLRISASKTRVAPNQAVTVSGRVTTYSSHSAIAGQLVELQRRPGSGASWSDVASRQTGAHGVVRFALHPSHSESYRLVALAENGAHRGVSPAIRIAIA